MRIFRKIRSLFSLLFEDQEQNYPPDYMLYQLNYDVLDEDAQTDVYDHILQVHKAGFRTEVRKLKEEIPSEYIGIVTRVSEGKLVCQKYLKLIEGYGGKMNICFHEISSSNRIE